MSREFEPRYLSYDANIAMCHRRLYSTILSEFPWYTEALVLKPESLLAHCESLPAFKSFLSSFHAFEDALLHFPSNPYMKDIRALLGVNVVPPVASEPSYLIVASHESTLSAYDFQKLCSVLCAYRFFEVISLRAQCVSRIPNSSPRVCMFLPGPASTKDGLDEFSRLQDWPKLARTFRKLVQSTTDGCSEFRSFPNPVFTLMHMAARNGVATKYLAIEENFLLTAIHVAALKNFPFAEGVLPDLPANMPSAPPGGFKDKESYDLFEAEYNAFTEKCQSEGTFFSAANVASRSPFQLAVMISPLYLFVTRRLSTKSFHRRTVIDLVARLGPHKPSRILAVESAIWDAVFCLAEGRVSIYNVLQDLAKFLPWSDIDMATNCDTDMQWFSPKMSMHYDSTLSLTLEENSHPLTIESSARCQSLPPLLSPVTQHIPSLSFLPSPLITRNACLDNMLRRISAELPLPRRNEDSKSGQVVVYSANFATMHRSSPLLPISPRLPSHSTPPDPFPTGFEAPTDRTVKPQPALLPPASLNILDAHPSHEPAHLTVNTLISPNIDHDTSGEGVESATSVQSNFSSPLSSPPRSLPSTPLNQSLSDHMLLSDREALAKCSVGGTDNDQADVPALDNRNAIRRFSSDDSDEGPTIQTSNARKPRASTKRRRPTSPLPSHMGSKENPIDVDKMTSLFEPVLAKEFLEKEEISLVITTNPPIKGNKPYTVFDAAGEPMSFTPSFHFEIYHERFRQFFDRVDALYDNGRPIHIARPNESVVKSFTYEAWKVLTPVQMQQELRKKNIIVSGWPLQQRLSFSEDGLRKVAGAQSRQISINDYSIKPLEGSCGPKVVSGHVQDIWDNRHPLGKILNALDLPLYNGNTELTEYTSDLHAWDVTLGHHHIDQSSPYPTGHMRWALVGHQNSMTFLHIDCEGLSTAVTVADGGKVWGFLRKRAVNPMSSINFFLKDHFCLDEVLQSSEYDFEVVALRPGDRLFMKPSQPHFVFGYAHSICLGEHFYSTHSMQETLQGLIHSFVLHKFLTNTTHPTRVLLRRIILFYHMGLIEDKVPASDPAASHLPDVTNIDGLMNLLSACVLVIMGNVLEFRTYRAPTQGEFAEADRHQQILVDNEINSIPLHERIAICYARGVALHIFSWIHDCFVITGPGGHIIDDLPTRFFIQIAQTLIRYKEGADASELDVQANCTLKMLTKQIDNIVAIEPCFASMWSKRHLVPSDSLALTNQDSFNIQRVSDNKHTWSDSPHDFYRDGITALDERYFAAQKERQRFETSLLIPQLNKDASKDRSSKRVRLG